MRGRQTTGTRRIKRAVIIGNSGGGKSTLARRLSSAWRSPHVEIDSLLWQPGWELTPVEIYNIEHARLIAEENWIIDGLGRLDSIPDRLARATDIVVVDMPLWMHFWLAAERQIRWSTGGIENPPAGLTKMPSTEALFRTIWEVKSNAENGFFGSARLPNSTSSKIGRERHRRSRCALSSPLPLAGEVDALGRARRVGEEARTSTIKEPPPQPSPASDRKREREQTAIAPRAPEIFEGAHRRPR
jgi:adenylate kinase family enzyme